MKVNYNDSEYYIKYISADLRYALIGPNKNKSDKLFKVDMVNLPDVTEKDLKTKLKKFITMGSLV
jgi:hypothetical protein